MSNPPKVQNYLDFDFSSDSAWKAYIEKVTPAPEGKVLEKKKRIWYRKCIDPDFDVFFDTNKSSADDKSKDKDQNKEGASTEKPKTGLERAKEEIYRLEGYIKMVFFIFIIFPYIPRTVVHLTGIMICLMAIVRQTAFSGLSSVFLKKLFTNDFLFNLGYQMIIWMYAGEGALVFAFPPAIHYAMGVVEFLSRTEKSETSARFKAVLSMVRIYRELIMETKCLFEVLIGVYLILLCLIENKSFYHVLLYFGLLAVKFFLNLTMRNAIRRAKAIAISFISK